MNLKERLDEIKEGTPIKVGTPSGFFYCYYKDKFTYQRIERESNLVVGKFQGFLNKRKLEYATLDIRAKKRIEKIKGYKTISAKKKKEKIEQIKRKTEEYRVSLPKIIANLEKKVAASVPFLDRQVIKEYHLNMPIYENPDTLYLIVRGKEQVGYGELQEYAKKYHLPIKNGDDRWKPIMAHRNKPKEETKRPTRFVKPQKGVFYKVKKDEKGNILGLVVDKERSKL